MKSTTGTRSGTASFKLKPTMVWAGQATAGAIWALAATGTVFAQDATPPAAPAAAASAPAPTASASAPAPAAASASAGETQSVVVVGIRRGIEDAIAVKKNATSIVEAVSAEDIGKLPDVSVAESLARLPGLAAQQVNGRAQLISIRGMSPDFANGLLNGREQVSTNDSRTVEFDQYPSELLSGAVVYKTADASLVGQGLAGTIDMQTMRPLNFSQRTIAVNARQEKNGVGTDSAGNGHRVSLSYIDQFADHTVGVVLGFAQLQSNTGETTRFESWGTGTTTYNGATVNVLNNGFNVYSDRTQETRNGFIGTFEWKPSKDFHTIVDFFRSTWDQKLTTKGFQAPLNDSWRTGPIDLMYDAPGVLSNATIVDGTAVAGDWNNVRGVVRNDQTNTKDNVTSLGWNTSYDFGNSWKVIADLAHSTATRDETHVETTAGTVGSASGPGAFDTVHFDNTGGTPVFTPGMNYTDPATIKLTDVQGWGGGPSTPQAGYSKIPHISDTLNAYRFDTVKGFNDGFLADMHLGVNYTNHTKSRQYTEAQLVIKGGDPFGAADVPNPGSMEVGGSGISVITFDPVANLNSIYDLVPKTHPDIYNKDWQVHEKITTGLAMANLDSEVGGLALTGNFGAQLIHTDQASTAFSVDSSSGTAEASTTTLGKSYNDVLPSLNLVLDIGNQQKMRFGLARQMARPNMADMRASKEVSFDATKGIYSGSGGSPTLDPYRANSVDLTYEKYFGTKAYLSAAAFYKDLKTYIVNETTSDFDWAPYVIAPPGQTTIGEFTRPVNGHGGNINGFELTASVPFNMLTTYLDGFGAIASYSHTDSSITPPDLTGSGMPTMMLPGQSKEVGSYTVYFEKWGFSARYNLTTRSNFVGSITDQFGDHQLTWIKGEPVSAYQLGYDITSGALNGLSFLLQVNNANNAPYIEFKGTPDNVTKEQRFGRQVLFGLNYKL